ncbi:MAG: aconitate hydratase AcnA [bacterium]
MKSLDSFKTSSVIKLNNKSYLYYSLEKLRKKGIGNITRLPVTLKVLLENLLRNEDGTSVKSEDIEAMASWKGGTNSTREIAFRPARVILQDFTGVPAVVDLAAMRDAIKSMGGNAKKINPLQPADLVIDHSIQIDFYGSCNAQGKNTELEFKRNHERYQLLNWAQTAFKGFRVIPPGTGIVHQVNIEYLANVAFREKSHGKNLIYPDTLVGTDSHTPMVNGLGVLGWGVGGIEAEAAMLGQPITMLIPDVIGVRITGKLPEEATAMDLTLTMAKILRKKGVVGKFIEFFGPGISNLPLENRAMLSNMTPEYGATVSFFPVDPATLNYLRLTGRENNEIAMVQSYYQAQDMFSSAKKTVPFFSDIIELDLSSIEQCIAGPKKPHDYIPLKRAKETFTRDITILAESTNQNVSEEITDNGIKFELSHGSIVIASITSCTNTSNPGVLIGAGLLAKGAVKRGLKVKPWVKTSLAPGSPAVQVYLTKAGLMPYLEALGFHCVGQGCATCIGNSGPLSPKITEAVKRGNLAVASILSGNRNFEGRINPLTKANYLASPLLVVTYAIAGKMNIDLFNEPLGHDPNGEPVYLKEIWPKRKDIDRLIDSSINPEMFKKEYAASLKGTSQWNNFKISSQESFKWNRHSTYVKCPPFFNNLSKNPEGIKDIKNARALAVLEDFVTTDHISPAGSIQKQSPAGKYLAANGIKPQDFNSYGSRRGNHEVMMRGTFANIRIKNLLVPGVEGGYTIHLPEGNKRSIFDAAMQYQKEKIPLLVLAGKAYGTGSSRDWAAKGTYLLGVKAVIAESYERIHRSNLVGMAVLPLQFMPGKSRESLGLNGTETYDIEGIGEGISVGKELMVTAVKANKSAVKFKVLTRIDTPVELDYYRHGGILQYVLRKLLNKK